MRFKLVATLLLLFTVTIFVLGVFVSDDPNPVSTTTVESPSIDSRYDFRSIRNHAGDTLLPVVGGDTLLLSPDSTFAYSLRAKNNLVAGGTWRIQGDLLEFTYDLPADTIRYYTISELSDTALIFSEGPVEFAFSRPRPSQPFIQSEEVKFSFSLNHIGRGLMGMMVLIIIGFALSTNRRLINWKQIGVGLGLQLIIAFGILHVEWVQHGFEWVSTLFVNILGYTREGSLFLFGSLIEDTESFGYIFAFQVLPTVIFFSALTSLFYYYGILQKVVYAFAWVMRNTMRLSGAESLAAAGNIFLGQTESPLLVKPYIAGMTKSELLCLMSGGMATIAGGVLAAYIGYLGGGNAAQEIYFANHLLAASVMSAPAAIVAAKLLVPETKEVNRDMHISRNTIGKSWLEAIANGTTEGLKLAVNVGAMLLVFTALIYMFNAILGDFIGHQTGLNDWVASVTDGQYNSLSLQFILGYGLAPLTWLMGVDGQDTLIVGQLLGEKTILNEFYAYTSMADMLQSGEFIHKRSAMIATYILCGFANFASIGIQIGGIGALAPSRKSELSKLGLRALLAGTMASLFTAILVGMLT